MDKMSEEVRARLEQEHAEVSNRIAKLLEFLKDKDPVTDPDVEALFEQLGAMNSYAAILSNRLAADDAKDGAAEEKNDTDESNVVPQFNMMKGEAKKLYNEVDAMWYRVSMGRDVPDRKEMTARLDDWKNRLYAISNGMEVF